MLFSIIRALGIVWTLAAPAAGSPSADTRPISCESCAKWNQPQPAFRIFGNTSYVGVSGLSAVLIESKAGLILIDGALPQSAGLIAANVKSLGHRIEDVKWILMSHAHYDHVGGIAALARMSGAKVATSPRAAAVMRQGMVSNDDPQFGLGDSMRFPGLPASVEIRELADGARLTVGDVKLTIHHTPGHTPGGTSWSWRTCEATTATCADMVYADSLNSVSAPGFSYSSDPARVRQFRASIAKVRGLRCDVLVSAHPDFSQLFERQAARGPKAGADPMFDSSACRRYADASASRLATRLADEEAAATK